LVAEQAALTKTAVLGSVVFFQFDFWVVLNQKMDMTMKPSRPLTTQLSMIKNTEISYLF